MIKEEYITDGNGNTIMISSEIIIQSPELIAKEIEDKEKQLLSMYDELLKLKEQKNNNINGTI